MSSLFSHQKLCILRKYIQVNFWRSDHPLVKHIYFLVYFVKSRTVQWWIEFSIKPKGKSKCCLFWDDRGKSLIWRLLCKFKYCHRAVSCMAATVFARHCCCMPRTRNRPKFCQTSKQCFRLQNIYNILLNEIASELEL